MLFNSAEFIFLFLPLTLFGFYLISSQFGAKRAIDWLILVSLFFYGWWKPIYLVLLLGSVLFNYGVGRWLIRAEKSPWQAKSILALGVVSNLALLGYFKYANFFVDNVNGVFSTDWHLNTIILPLAISFFTFQQIAYLVDHYRGQVKEREFRDYALFVTFFPQLVAGPIVHHKDMMPQFSDTQFGRFLSSNIAIGLAIFALGLFKKTIIADGIAQYSNTVFSMADAGETVLFLEAWVGALAYSLQLYFDFSGYSDMAIGIARMFGLVLPINFFSPYKAGNIIEFWRRWHITLSHFLRDYLYFSLGGNRKGPVRRHVNLMITMLLGGLWHGAGWNFVVWGGLHGLYLVLNHSWRRAKSLLGWSASLGLAERIAGHMLTLVAVIVAWVYFRAESMGAANHIIAGMFGFNGYQPPSSFLGHALGAAPETAPVLLGNVIPLLSDTAALVGVKIFGGIQAFEILILLIPFLLLALFAPNVAQIFANKEGGAMVGLTAAEVHSKLQWKTSVFWACIIGLVAAYSIFGATNVSEFLYFNF